MKRAVKGFVYDTKTSTPVAQWSQYIEDEHRGATEVLYKTRTGAFFTHFHEEFRVKKRKGFVEKTVDFFDPMTPDEVRKWLNETDVEILDDETFSELPEASPLGSVLVN
jgi:hypothetical protein